VGRLSETAGIAAERLGKLDIADAHFTEAIASLSKIGATAREADDLVRLGRVKISRTLHAEAIPLFQKCLDMTGGLGFWNQRCREGLGDSYLMAGDREKAEIEYRASIATTERDGATGDTSRRAIYEKLIALLADRNRIDDALSYLQRSRCQTLVSTIHPEEVGTIDPLLRPMMLRSGEQQRRRTDLRQTLRSEYSKPKAEQDPPLLRGATTLLASTEQELNDTLARIRQHDPSYSSVTRVDPSVWADARDMLPADALLVEYLPTDSRLLIFAARGKGKPILKQVPIERKALDALIDRNRREIRSLDEANETSRELYRVLIEPIAGEIKDAGILAIMPAGRLFYVPFPALFQNDETGTRRYLIEKKPIVIITELIAWRFMRKNAETLGPSAPYLVAFANPTGDLASAETEVGKIGGRYSQKKVFVRGEATVARAQDVPKECTTLHFAAHGVLLDKPVTKSHLRMADGLLTQRDIYGLGLKGKKTRLVVLSGCETASGLDQPGAEFLGLADAFSKAGASAVLGTLWKIETESAAQLMDRFYAGHAGSPRAATAAHALQQAQIEMLRSREFGKPFFWAPYVLIGDWR
jgi:CHAT domain-containing protein